MNEHNVNAIIVGTGEFAFAEGAATAAAAAQSGYVDVGNVRSVAIQPEKEQVQHYGSYRGIRRKDKTIVTQSDLKYLVRIDEAKYSNVLYMIFGSAASDFTQSSISSTAVDALDFSGGNDAVIGRWYQIEDSGVAVREVTALTIPTLTEGTDFVLDGKLGRVRFLTAQTSSLTPTISADAVTALKAATPLGKLSREGFARLTMWDQDDNDILVLDHADFKCEVSINNQPELTPDSEMEIELMVEVLDVVGTVYTREE